MVADSSPPIDPDGIASRTFNRARRGFDPDEVRAHLVQVAGQIRELIHRHEELGRRVVELERRAADPRELDEETVTAMLGEQTAKLLVEARRTATEMKEHAEQEAAAIRLDATEAASTAREEAERHAEAVRSLADEADEKIRADAQAYADGIREAADRETAEQRAAADEYERLTRENVDTELETLRAKVENEVSELRRQAESVLAERTSEAETEATRIRSEADSYREETRGDADRYAEQVRGEADAYVAESRAAADELRETSRTQSEAEAEATIERARDEGRSMVQEARDYRERVIADLADRRRAARHEMEQMAATRDALAITLTDARLQIERAHSLLQQARIDPSGIGDPGVDRRALEPEPEPESAKPLEAETEPEAEGRDGDPASEPEDPDDAIEGGTGAEVEVDEAEPIDDEDPTGRIEDADDADGAGEAATEPIVDAATEDEGEGEDDTAVVELSIDERTPVWADESGAEGDDSETSGPVGSTAHDADDESAPTDVLDADPADLDGAQGSEHADHDHSEADLELDESSPQGDAGPVGAPAPAEDTEPAGARPDGGDGATVHTEAADVDGETDAELTDDTEAADDDAEEGIAPGIDDLFARIRAERDEQAASEDPDGSFDETDETDETDDSGEEAQDDERTGFDGVPDDVGVPGATTGATDETVEVAEGPFDLVEPGFGTLTVPATQPAAGHSRSASDGDDTGAGAVVVEERPDAEANQDEDGSSDDEDLLELRDGATDAVERQLARRLKRELADEQNELLDLLRRTGADADRDAVLPTPEDHLARYRDAALEDLRAAERAGASFYGDAPEREADIDDVATEFAADLVRQIRGRMERAFDDGAGEDEVAEAVRTLYREWKTQRIAGVARHFVVTAFSRGVLEAGTVDSSFRWLVDHGGGAAPDCEDNALAGSVPRGEPYPTGDRYPPIHPGCRCLIVPVAL